MPFDAKGYEAHTLADHLAMVGITPVPMTVLEAHKAEQVRKHPGTILNQPWPYLLFSSLVVGTCAIVAMVRWPPSDAIGLVLAVFATVLLIILGTGLSVVGTMVFSDVFKIRVLDNAVWSERPWCYQAIPQPIEDIIDRMGDSAGGTVCYGELIQNEVTLDPYIVVRTRTEVACLGIWDGDTIIAIAELH